MRKYRQCPYCKNKKGFSFIVTLGGTEYVSKKFNGEVISQERWGKNKIDNYATCMNCGKQIDTDRLDTD